MAPVGYREYSDTVRAGADIVDVVSEVVSLRRAGRSLTGLCPFHQEKTPSFHVDPAKQVYYCFGCRAGGDVFDFIMTLHNVPFPEAVRWLGDKLGIAPPAPRHAAEAEADRRRRRILESLEKAQAFFAARLWGEGGEGARGYLARRGLEEDQARRFGLGFAPPGWDGLLRHLVGQGFQPDDLVQAGLVVPRPSGSGAYDRFRARITFPIRDSAGRAISFGGRAIGDEEPKYLNGPETSVYDKGRTLFRLFESAQEIRQSGRAVVVEGYFDAVGLAAAGVPGVVAVCGTALGPEHVKLLQRWTARVVLFFDADAAGRRAVHAALGPLLGAGVSVSVATAPDGMDPDDLARRRGKEGVAAVLDHAADLPTFLVDEAGREFPLATIEGKLAALEMVLQHLSHLPSSVARTEIMSRVADGLSIDDALFRQELRRVAADRRRQLRAPPQATPGGARVLTHAEEVVVRFLVGPAHAGGAEIEGVLSELDGIEFGELAASLVRRWCDARGRGESWDLRRLAESAPEGVRSQLLALAFAPGEEPGVAEARGALASLHGRSLNQRLREVQEEIERTADPAARSQLLMEKVSLAKEIQALGPAAPAGPPLSAR